MGGSIVATTKLQQRENSTNRMLQAAFTEFSTKGYSGARVTEIAKMSDVSPGLLGQRFGGKEELFNMVVRDWSLAFFDEIKDAQSAEEVFRRTVDSSRNYTDLRRHDMKRIISLVLCVLLLTCSFAQTLIPQH